MIEVFNRFENKYLIGGEVFAKLQQTLAGEMDLDGYNETSFTYPICNIYYDTPDNRVIRASIAKPTYKEKLRLRSYGTPTEGSTVYAEIKKKFGGKVNKRRSGLKLDEAYRFLATGDLPIVQPYMNAQVLREAQYILSRLPLEPAVYLAYERRAFKGAFDQRDADLRVSFDTNIVTRRHDLRLESGVYGEPLLPDGAWLMEIKSASAIPLWLTRLLAEYKIYSSSFSKYGAEYSRMISRTYAEKPVVSPQQEPQKPQITRKVRRPAVAAAAVF